MAENKRNIRKSIGYILWLGVAVLSIWLLVAAVSKQSTAVCKDIDIQITGVRNHFFLDKADVLFIINSQQSRPTIGSPISSINLHVIEEELERNIWIDNAELFFDNNYVLRVELDEREPVARIFHASGKSFYIDHRLKILPLSDKFSARLPLFTGYTGNIDALSASDSVLLSDIRDLSVEIYNDSFMMAMIDQVDIKPNAQFEMYPKIGDQKIEFGNAESIVQKFNKLKLFYKQVIPQSGWSKYSVIRLQYKDQVVAKHRDKAEIVADSLRALEMLEALAARAAIEADNSGSSMLPERSVKANDGSMIEKSVQRDEVVADTESALPAPVEAQAPAPIQPVQPVQPNRAEAPKPETKKPELGKPEVKKQTENKIIDKPKTNETPKKETEKRVPKAVMGAN